MANKVTEKQEQFAQLVANGMTKAAAYREAYDVENEEAPSIYVNSCKLAKDDKVALRIKEIQAELREKLQVDKETLTLELENARRMAEMTNNAAASISATMGKAKLHGLLIDKVEAETKNHVFLNEMSDEELDRRIAEEAEKRKTLKGSEE